MKMKDVKKFASTKHKGLPEKKVTKESTFAGNYNGPLYARWSDVEKGRNKPIGNEEQETQLENKSGDNSLRDWFGKSRSSDGKLAGFSSVVNMQENPVPNNLDKQQNPSAVQVK